MVATAVNWRRLLPAAALAYLALMYSVGSPPRQQQFVAFEAAGVMALTPEHVRAVVLESGAQRYALRRSAGGWTSGRNLLDARARAELERGLKYLHTARPVRDIGQPELEGAAREPFGLAPPWLTLTVEFDDASGLRLEFGGPNSDDTLDYLHVASRGQLVLTSRFFTSQWRLVREILQTSSIDRSHSRRP
jgi:hypothetical protein